jgi:hypothetical protein
VVVAHLPSHERRLARVVRGRESAVGSAAWVMVAVAVALIVIALVVFVVPFGRGESTPTEPRAETPSSSDSLARGFGYLQLTSRSVGRSPGVQERLARAFARIDAVDPHATPRRVGEALVQAGLVDPPAASPSSTTRPTTSPEHPRDPR